jgi:surface protein
MDAIFYGCSNLTSLDISGFNTTKVKSMYSMFYGCSNLTSLDVSGFKTDKVTDMYSMFYGCSNLTSLDVSGFNTENVTNMSYMFSECSNLTSLDLSGFKTDNVTDMYKMFYICSNLTSLDLSSFKTDNVTLMGWMFSNCSNLMTIYVSDLWDMSSVTYSSYMFHGCFKLVGGAGTTWDYDHDGDYARIDEGKSKPGYFTYKEYSGIETPLSIGMGASGVYNLGGAKVRSAQEGANGLPSGLYIVNKKKILVK